MSCIGKDRLCPSLAVDIVEFHSLKAVSLKRERLCVSL